MNRQCLLFFYIVILVGCSTNQQTATLADIDVAGEHQEKNSVFIKPKSDDEIRKAYAEYLAKSNKSDKSRIEAISRLAELEFELASKIAEEKKPGQNDEVNLLDDRGFIERVNRTIELLTTSLKDYPEAKGNDRILYQLAKAYDQKGDSKNALLAMQRLVEKYRKSDYYLEGLFRLAEHSFSSRKFRKAEELYTEIIVSENNQFFYEKSVFKRGWSRFKQEFYLEAVDDFLETVTYHNFDEYKNLSRLEQDQFNEYFRAIGLSFSYLGGAERLNRYFDNNSNFRYIYYTYAHVSEIYNKQHRYNDAVKTLLFFNQRHPTSRYVPDSHKRIIQNWIDGGFSNKATSEIEAFYTSYNPQSKYWINQSADNLIFNDIRDALKKFILLASEHYHNKYRETKKIALFNQSSVWYSRYLNHFSSTAQKDGIFYRYAELLSSNGDYNQALTYYEKAAFDSGIILNKQAAYASILMCNKLLTSSKAGTDIQILDKLINYSSLYSQLYPDDQHTSRIIINSAQIAYRSKQYAKVIELAELNIAKQIKSRVSLDIIRSHSYFSLEEYENAEVAYQSVLNTGTLSSKARLNLVNRLALSIYRQAEVEKKKSNRDLAAHHYSRIITVAPQSEIASTGLYDAISIYLEDHNWETAIQNIRRFQKFYPQHKHNSELARALSAAYLKSGQSLMAAQEFERISTGESDRETKMAALWKAAELYEEKNNLQPAIRAYEEYAKKFTSPYPQYVEAMNKLVKLHTKSTNHKQAILWQNKILTADKRVTSKTRTERTKYITSVSALKLATGKHEEFNSQQLVLPLATSLKKKKRAMLEAVKLYGMASSYGVAETSTQATHAIASIYKSFSEALLNSERPRNLKGEELNQYQILLEDRAFPFEEKAIEFYEINLWRTRDNLYDEWIQRSYEQLKQLFPARYNRQFKMDSTINVLH